MECDASNRIEACCDCVRGKALAGVMVRGIFLADVVRRIRSVSRGPTRPGIISMKIRRFLTRVFIGVLCD